MVGTGMVTINTAKPTKALLNLVTGTKKCLTVLSPPSQDAIQEPNTDTDLNDRCDYKTNVLRPYVDDIRYTTHLAQAIPERL